MELWKQLNLLQTRRQFFGKTGLRAGGIAMAAMGVSKLASAVDATRMHQGLKELPHFAPKAKSLIYLHMNGGPSQIDLWDYKPKLEEQFDKDLPESIRNGQRITTMTSGQARLPVAPSKFKFTQQGQCGRWISELLPHTAKMVDDLAVIKTLHTNAINHDPACTFVMTGNEVPGRPASVRGCRMAWGAKATIYLRSSFSLRDGRALRLLKPCSLGCGPVDFCRPDIRG